MEHYNEADRDSVLSSHLIDHRTRPTLLNLPLETRQNIYEYIFHSFGCNKIEGLDVCRGCHCGDNLSTVSRQLYGEARPLVYKCANPIFLDVESCLRFLRVIRNNVVYMKSLSVVDRYRSSQSHMLADVCRYQGLEGLEALHFSFGPWEGSLRTPRRSEPTQNGPPPIYSLVAERNNPAAVYDMRLRVSKHPLAAMKNLRRLNVVGNPPSDIEEAIFKAGMNIEDLGRKEGKTVTRCEAEDDPLGWLYGILIDD